ncbi:MAG: tRNA pseudouridine(38-40) synthase TruA [Candidatus Omnitrophica bacterium]|nr:tRNA pseudouridine(38-40) synthase TruA [Candidatus Omnitrophota bacterium]MDD5488117.1 tRNA pseudouridine(38-40) synthase TruA [Candidatus Omnitrophota bacterium]
MRNIKLVIAYDGTDYKGWQFQDNGLTVQEMMERALGRVLGRKHRVHGASRTDSGVHALGQVVGFKTSHTIPVEKLPLALNPVLPETISVISAEEVDADFHVRFSAVSKKYTYHIFNSRQRDPFIEKYSWRVPYRLDIALMRKESRALLGKHDFKSFQAKDKIERGAVRTISGISIRKAGKNVHVTVKGDGFLYNMVRNVVGTLVDIGRGYLPPGSMKAILEKKDRVHAGPTAPAKGLFLVEVRY